MTDRLEQLAETARRYPKLLALLLGLTAAAGYPPIHAWPIGLLSVAGLVWLIFDATDWRAALGRGWLFGWAHLTLANNWIATAFTYQANMPEWLGWLAVPLLCIYLAWYPALAALAAHVMAKRAGPLAFGLVFAAAWIVTEWLRSWVFTGYPWPPLGLMLLGAGIGLASRHFCLGWEPMGFLVWQYCWRPRLRGCSRFANGCLRAHCR